MEHLYKFLSKPNADEILSDGQLTATLKMDGAALQLTFKDGEPIFHKRSGEPNKEGEVIRDVDMYLSNFYYDSIEYLKGKMEGVKSFVDFIRILNFEIFSDKGDMDILINYKRMPKNNICLLGGITTKDEGIKQDIVSEIGRNLDTDICPVLFTGILGKDKASKLRKFAEDNKEGKGKGNLLDFIKELFGVSGNEMLDNTTDGIIEGIVLSFNHNGKDYVFKLDDPEFTKRWNSCHKKDEGRKSNIEEVGNMICDCIDRRGFSLHKQSDSVLVNLIENFMSSIAKDEECRMAFSGFYDRNKDNLRLNWNSRMVPTDYRKELLNSKDHVGELLCAWVLLLQRRTKREDSPIRKRLNSLVDKML